MTCNCGVGCCKKAPLLPSPEKSGPASKVVDQQPPATPMPPPPPPEAWQLNLVYCWPHDYIK